MGSCLHDVRLDFYLCNIDEPGEELVVSHRYHDEIASRMGHPADAWLFAVAEAAGGVLVTFDKALAARGAHCLLGEK